MVYRARMRRRLLGAYYGEAEDTGPTPTKAHTDQDAEAFKAMLAYLWTCADHLTASFAEVGAHTKRQSGAPSLGGFRSYQGKRGSTLRKGESKRLFMDTLRIIKTHDPDLTFALGLESDDRHWQNFIPDGVVTASTATLKRRQHYRQQFSPEALNRFNRRRVPGRGNPVNEQDTWVGPDDFRAVTSADLDGLRPEEATSADLAC